MMKINLSFIAIPLILHCFPSFAEVSIQKDIVSFSTVNDIIRDKQKKYGVDEVLLVFDLDNTLLTTDVDLGGDIWSQWQKEGLDGLKASDEPQAEPRCKADAVEGMLYELGTMHPVEHEQTVNYINDWQIKGFTTFVLTSRNGKYRTATERELSRNGLDFSKTALASLGDAHPEFSYIALDKGKSKKDFENYKQARYAKVSYQNGVFMTANSNKGSMLDQILEKTGRQFDAIIFVDDRWKNIANVADAFEKRATDVTAVHYTKVENDRKIKQNGKVLTAEQVKKMTSDWIKLEETLNSIFPERAAIKCSD